MGGVKAGFGLREILGARANRCSRLVLCRNRESMIFPKNFPVVCDRVNAFEPRQAFGMHHIPALLLSFSASSSASASLPTDIAPEYGALQTLRAIVCFGLFLLVAGISSAALVPAKIKPAIRDVQDFQTPDHVRLGGWIGTRIEANEGNRLAKIDVDRLLEGYRKRPGRQIWDGEHVGKWLHAATLAWANTGDPELRKKLDYVAAELPKCQLADGYLGTYEEKDRWTLWDVWAHKYNLIGLITYMRYTGNMAPLPACRRMADLLCRTFGDEPGKRDLIKAGEHVGLAPTSVLEPMVLLYRLVG